MHKARISLMLILGQEIGHRLVSLEAKLQL